jgi:hypothetical protein
MRRSWERRLAALEARARDALPVNRLLIPCIIRQDACSARPNPCFSDDASPDDWARVVDLQGWRACSAHRGGLPQSPSLPQIHQPHRDPRELADDRPAAAGGA